MRERPAAQRTIDLAELCRYEAFYSQHLPYFCCIRDVDYVVRTVLKTKDKALKDSWKPLWLLGGTKQTTKDSQNACIVVVVHRFGVIIDY